MTRPSWLRSYYHLATMLNPLRFMHCQLTLVHRTLRPLIRQCRCPFLIPPPMPPVVSFTPADAVTFRLPPVHRFPPHTPALLYSCWQAQRQRAHYTNAGYYLFCCMLNFHDGKHSDWTGFSRRRLSRRLYYKHATLTYTIALYYLPPHYLHPTLPPPDTHLPHHLALVLRALTCSYRQHAPSPDAPTQ